MPYHLAIAQYMIRSDFLTANHIILTFSGFVKRFSQIFFLLGMPRSHHVLICSIASCTSLPRFLEYWIRNRMHRTTLSEHMQTQME